MTEVPALRDGGVLLRAHTEADLDAVWEQCQDPDMQRFTTVPVPYAREDAAWFLEHVRRGWEDGSAASWAIEVDGRFAGSVDLRFGEGWASIGYGLHPWARGRGVMTTAAGLALGWGFGERDLVGVRWEALVGNTASRRVAERNGFLVEGTARGSSVARGQRHDAWIGSLLADEWRARRTTR
ncbi:GNAT family N-acetyltransferase [Klenkia taihuensis]|uniref:Protein N-acetyltransferase, RimJ/RimL family n=1 Tax=Klenkia taihuensis TaxID=1225127 RepID=A0A1I1SAR1_9ACTN|nr:GNAT family protein [Klenkia taihuensis]GHE13564.1 acetyltransferase [Klenkia taihuensis]SFD43546.1 Protein N-acetyltransferase, RimJ/RimL family [Klenkia taihuensis]